MVYKTIRRGQRTGNTVRSYMKNIFMYRIFGASGNSYFEDNENEQIIIIKQSTLRDLDDVLQNENGASIMLLSKSHMKIELSFSFSLKKRKRWMYNSFLEEKIENLKDTECIFVIDRKKVFQISCSVSNHEYQECFRNIESKKANTSTRRHDNSCLTDLRRKCLMIGKMDDSKVVRRKNHIKRFRGIQRKTELSRFKIQMDDDRKYVHRLPADEDSEDTSEICCRICKPIKNLSKSHYFKYPCYPSCFLCKIRRGRNWEWYVKKWISQEINVCIHDRSYVDSLKSSKCVPGICRNCQTDTYDSYSYGEGFIDCESDVYTCFHSHDRHLDRYIVTDKVKGIMEVELADLIKIAKQKKKSVKIKKPRLKEKQLDNSKKGRAIFETEKNIISNLQMSVENDQNNSIIQKVSESTNTFDVSLCTHQCLLRKRDVPEYCMNRSDCMFSNSTVPPTLLIPIYKRPENEIVSLEVPCLIINETLSSVCSESENDIATYRLRIHMDKENIDIRNATEGLRMFTSQNGFPICSVHEIINHLKTLLQFQFVDARPVKERNDGYTTLQGLWSWMPAIRYKVKTVKEAASDILYSQRTQMKKSKCFFQKEIINKWHNGECGVCCVKFDQYPELEGMVLLPCQHVFCKSCLCHYATDRIMNGTLHIQCMEYMCTSQIDEITVLSLISSKLFNQWLERRHENAVVKSGIWKYCPNNKCNRVVSLENCGHVQSMSVKCHCKQEFCIQCQSPPHWPSSCKQREFYKKIVEQKGQLINISEKKSYFVKVKSCPECGEYFEQDQYCKNMTCRCSHNFCWYCLMPYSKEFSHRGLRCGPPVSETVIELDNIKAANLPSICFEKPLVHRKAWMDIERIRRKKFSSFCANKGFGKYHNEETVLSEQQLQHFIELKEVHKLMENVYCSLSNSTKKVRSHHHIQEEADRIYFITSRLIELLQTSSRPEVNQRIQKLQTILQNNLQVIVAKAMSIQKTLQPCDPKKLHFTYRYV